MSDDFWQDITELVYDAVNNDLYTDEEREALIEDAFSTFAGYTSNAGNIPDNFRRRRTEFYSPVDLLYWVEDGGIPPSAVYIHKHKSVRDNSDRYTTYISPTS